MKKILKCLSITALLMNMFEISNLKNNSIKLVNAEEIFYTNLNNVSMTKEEYQKLSEFGFVDLEIEHMTYEQFEEIQEMKIISKLYGDTNESSASTFSMDPNPDVYAYEHERYYTLRGTYYEDYNGQEAYFIKVDVSYTSNPDDWMTDILAITMESNVMPMPVSETTINIFGTFSYNEIIYEECDQLDYYQEIETINHYYSYSSVNTSKYRYYPDSSVAMKFELPKPKRNSSRDEIVDEIKYTIDNNSKYSNIYMSMYCYFVPEVSNVINTSFTGAHIHQCTSFDISWSGISIIPQFPFIRASVDITVNEEVEVIYRNLYYSTNITYPNC